MIKKCCEVQKETRDLRQLINRSVHFYNQLINQTSTRNYKTLNIKYFKKLKQKLRSRKSINNLYLYSFITRAHVGASVEPSGNLK